MEEVYIVRFTPLSSGREHLSAFDSFEKAKKYIESIPYIVETHPGFWESYENVFRLGWYTIDTLEVV